MSGTTESMVDLAAIVRNYMDENAMGDWSLESEELARTALDALVARCEQAERREELALNGARAQSERAEAAEAERDEMKVAYHQQRGLRERSDMDATEALARVAELEAALREAIEQDYCTICGAALAAPDPEGDDRKCPSLHPGYPANRCERPVGHGGDHYVITLRTGGMQYGPVKWPDPEGGAA